LIDVFLIGEYGRYGLMGLLLSFYWEREWIDSYLFMGFNV